MASLQSLGVPYNFPLPDEADRPNSIPERCYRLYRTDMTELTLSDVRFMIGQKVGLEYLVPIALEALKQDIMVEASYYEGDLLNGLLTVPEYFWEQNKTMVDELKRLIRENEMYLDEQLTDTTVEIRNSLLTGISLFPKSDAFEKMVKDGVFRHRTRNGKLPKIL